MSWPGPTFEAHKNEPLCVLWVSRLPLKHLLTGINGVSIVDETLHWAYALEGYQNYTIEKNGVPVVPHVHGAHTDFQYDGNPEFFFSSEGVEGPQYRTNQYIYENDQSAAAIWYHDHALGKQDKRFLATNEEWLHLKLTLAISSYRHHSA